MSRVGIAELKSRLSEHLRRVKKGEPVTVLDRDTPIAVIQPIGEPGTILSLHKPSGARPGDLKFPARRKIRTDIVDLLDRERSDR